MVVTVTGFEDLPNKTHRVFVLRLPAAFIPSFTDCRCKATTVDRNLESNNSLNDFLIFSKINLGTLAISCGDEMQKGNAKLSAVESFNDMPSALLAIPLRRDKDGKQMAWSAKGLDLSNDTRGEKNRLRAGSNLGETWGWLSSPVDWALESREVKEERAIS